MSVISSARLESSQFNYPKHVTHILHHNSGDIGNGVDVVFRVVLEARAGHEVEVLRTALRRSAAQAWRSRSGALVSMMRTGWSVAGWDMWA